MCQLVSELVGLPDISEVVAAADWHVVIAECCSLLSVSHSHEWRSRKLSILVSPPQTALVMTQCLKDPYGMDSGAGVPWHGSSEPKYLPYKVVIRDDIIYLCTHHIIAFGSSGAGTGRR